MWYATTAFLSAAHARPPRQPLIKALSTRFWKWCLVTSSNVSPVLPDVGDSLAAQDARWDKWVREGRASDLIARRRIQIVFVVLCAAGALALTAWQS